MSGDLGISGEGNSLREALDEQGVWEAEKILRFGDQETVNENSKASLRPLTCNDKESGYGL